MKKLVLIIPLLLLTACIQVPYSKITFGSASARLPKDMTAASMEITLASGTNTMTFKATNISTKNNPDVINASTAQLEAVINATANAVAQGAATAAKAAAK